MNTYTAHGVTIHNKRDVTPAWAVYVGRPTAWGNPFRVEWAGGREAAIRDYERWIEAPEQALLRSLMRQRLAGRDLVCWCAPAKCHAEIIARIANG